VFKGERIMNPDKMYECPCSVCVESREKRALKKAADAEYVRGYTAGEESAIQSGYDRGYHDGSQDEKREGVRVDKERLFIARGDGYNAGRAAIIRIRDNEENAALQQAHKAGYEQGHDDAEDAHYDSGYEDGRAEMLEDVKDKLEG